MYKIMAEFWEIIREKIGNFFIDVFWPEHIY